MVIKEGVNIQGLNIKMRKVLIVADKVWNLYGQDLVVTSGLEGDHMAGSFHPFGYALDFRTRYFTQEKVTLIVLELRVKLPEFEIIQETDHIHVEPRFTVEGN